MTDAVRKSILDAVRLGTGLYRAAELAGVSSQSFRRYMRKGEEEAAEGRRTTAAKFVADVSKQTAHIGHLMEGSVVHAALHGRDVKAAQWWLERRLPDEYGRHDKVTVDVQQKMAVDFLDFIRERVDVDCYQQILRALAPSGGDEEATVLQLA